MSADLKDSRDRWVYRRSLVYALNVVCLLFLLVITLRGPDDELRRLVAENLIWTVLIIDGLYLLGPVAEDLVGKLVILRYGRGGGGPGGPGGMG